MESHAIRDGDSVQLVLDGLRRIVQGLRESSVASQRRTRLTTAQLFVLRRLSQTDGASVTALAAQTFTHQSSVSVVVSRLVEAGCVARRPDPADRRRRLLVVTPAGRAALAAAPASASERLAEAVQAIAPQARRRLGLTLARLAEAMDVRTAPEMFLEQRGRR